MSPLPTSVITPELVTITEHLQSITHGGGYFLLVVTVRGEVMNHLALSTWHK
jgi:hypothetical protein